jgi:hypothetical protein
MSLVAYAIFHYRIKIWIRGCMFQKTCIPGISSNSPDCIKHMAAIGAYSETIGILKT